MATDFERILKERVLLLDGATGVILQKYGCSNLDMLSLTHPGLVAGVHDAYLAAGADIIETNTFTIRLSHDSDTTETTISGGTVMQPNRRLK